MLLFQSSLFEVPPPLSPSPTTISILLAHKDGYKYHARNANIKLLTISQENIVFIHRKISVKIADLPYFSQLKKYSKV